MGHAEHDAQQYVPPGEREAWALKDPLARYEARLLAENHATQQELDAIAARVVEEVDRAREIAEASPMPEPEWALGGVYGDMETEIPWTRLAEAIGRRPPLR